MAYLYSVFALWFALAAVLPALHAEPIERSQIWAKDGDTVIKDDGDGKWSVDQEYRLVGFDTPETKRPQAKCAKEIEKGTRAAARLIALLDAGPIDLTEVQCSCPTAKIGNKSWTAGDPTSATCNHERRCGVLKVNGKDVGETLIAEGHAMPFHCSATKCPRMHKWCDAR